MQRHTPAPLSLLAAILLLSGCRFSLGTQQDRDPFHGAYRGVIWTGTETPSGTAFFRSEDGKTIAGRYVMEARAGNVPGDLRDCAFAERTLKCLWTDKDGSGPMTITFSADFKSFEGSWAPAEHPGQSNPWTGRKL